MFRRRYENGRIMDGSKEYICERICRTYIETGRTVRSLAGLYGCSKSTIHNYLSKYASDCVSYGLNRAVRSRAKQNKLEVYEFGQSENRYSDQYGSMD
jgi:hypothetical protein